MTSPQGNPLYTGTAGWPYGATSTTEALAMMRDLDGRKPCANCAHSILYHGDRALIHCGAKDATWVPATGYRPFCKCNMYREFKD